MKTATPAPFPEWGNLADARSFMNSGKTPAHGPAERQQLLWELQIADNLRRCAPVDDLREYFDSSGKTEIFTSTLEVNVTDLLMIQRALAANLPGWTVLRECNYGYPTSNPGIVKRMAVEVAPKTYDYVIRKGRQFWVGPDGQRLVVDIFADDDRDVCTSEITFTIPVSEHAWLTQLIPVLHRWTNRNHFLRGQAIGGDGSLLTIPDHGLEWEDLMLTQEVRDSIRRNCVDLLTHAELYRINGVPLKRGLVLHGPPGTGKTTIGRTLARHCSGTTFILITPGMVEEAEDVRRIFTWGRRFAPTILFFEDFDLVASDRHNLGSTSMLGEFLSCLDGLDSKEGMIVVATTNNLEAIEPALKDRPNRFDCILEIAAPTRLERARYLKRWKERRPTIQGIGTPESQPRDSGSVQTVIADDFDPEAVADSTDGLTGAQLQELCRLAVFEAVDNQVRSGAPGCAIIPLTHAHFESALRRLGVQRKTRIGFTSEQ